MAASKNFYRFLLVFMISIKISLPQLNAAEPVGSKISHVKSEENSGPTIVFSTPFPEIAPSHSIYKSIYSEVFRRMGYGFEMIYYPDQRGPIEVNAGHVDGSTGRLHGFDTGNNHPNLLRVDEIVLSHTGIALVKDAEIRIRGWKSLKGYKVSYISGDKWIEDNLPDYVNAENIIGASDWLQATRLLDAGRVDIYIELDDILTIVKKVDEFKNRQFFNGGTVATIDVYPYLHKKNKALVEPLIVGLKSMKADGTYERLVSKRVPSDG